MLQCCKKVVDHIHEQKVMNLSLGYVRVFFEEDNPNLWHIMISIFDKDHPFYGVQFHLEAIAIYYPLDTLGLVNITTNFSLPKKAKWKYEKSEITLQLMSLHNQLTEFTSVIVFS